MSAAKWWGQLLYRGGQAHGILGYGAIPGADIPTAVTQKLMPKSWLWSIGMRSRAVATLSPWAMGASAAYTWKATGALDRLLDVTFHRGQEGAHWENTPKQKYEARHTHGFFVSPGDRMTRNPPMISSAQLADQGYRT